ncbi:hypothetical protein EDC04DRAFT_1514419 [Pisolithus marmoratus]|nr:hypothetical protein EDC04DRAFT_1514419 [Pisolithus marmoratus]
MAWNPASRLSRPFVTMLQRIIVTPQLCAGSPTKYGLATGQTPFLADMELAHPFNLVLQYRFQLQTIQPYRTSASWATIFTLTIEYPRKIIRHFNTTRIFQQPHPF